VIVVIELKKHFDYILENYLLPENMEFSSAKEYYKVIVSKIPSEISKLFSNSTYKIYGSCGKGAKSAAPYIAIINRKISTTTQKGIYVDFIFKSDMSGFYLTIDQGITSIKDKYGNKESKIIAQKAVNYFRNLIEDKKGFEYGLVSGHTKAGSLEEGYENTRVLAKYYDKNNYSNDELIDDLNTIMKIYDEIVSKMNEKSYDEIVQLINDDSISDDENNDIQYWTYSPGEDGKEWNYCFNNNKMVIGYDIGSLEKYNNRDEFAKALNKRYGKNNPYNDVSCVDDFRNKLKKGDIVIAKIGRSKLLGYGKVIDDQYIYDDKKADYKHVRNVRWLKHGEWTVPKEFRFALKTLTDITPYDGFAQKLLNIMNGENNMLSNVNEWIIPANPKSYEHRKSFEKNGFIDWSQSRNLGIGDIVYIYLGQPEQRIFAVTKVEKINLDESEIVNDSEFWIKDQRDAAKFVRLRLINFLDDDRLSLLNLEKHGMVGAPMGGMKLSEKPELTDYLHSIIDLTKNVSDNIKNNIELFRDYYNEHIVDIKNSKVELDRIKQREELRADYPITKLRKLSIDEYSLGTDNSKNSLSYNLEFGKYRAAGPGIGGGTSAKHGFYKGADGNFHGIRGKIIDNPEAYWKEFINQLADFYTECKNIKEPLRASKKYPLLKGMSMVLTKVLYVYYPEKFINICSDGKLKKLMDYFGYKYTNDMKAEELNFLLSKNIRADIKELEKNDPQFIGSLLWKYVNEVLEEDKIEDDEPIINDVISVDSDRNTGAYNKIVYGIPGCGKSYYVAHEIIDKDDKKGGVYRTTFFPDYTNGDFVGQVIPKLNNKDESSVIYDIQSGPFTEAILNAIINPLKNTYLVIEEINRGNAAAIFGDIFQLLDRDINGSSEYNIKNYIVSTFLHKNIDDKYSVDYDLDNIKIPSNLIIIGTMNTSDQNVFTLDTAFKRRWKMEYIKNDINTSKYAKEIVPMSDVTWAEFVNEINDYITGENGLDINGEDKQIGAYFISDSEWNDIKTTKDSKEAARIFAEKVLSYIWDDVAKINRDSWFDSNKYRTLDSIVSSYMEKGLEVFSDNISFTRSKEIEQSNKE